MRSLFLPNGDDSYTVFPRVDITEHVYLMGDYMSEDYESMKAYTQFKIKTDWLEIQKEAFDLTLDYISSQASTGIVDYPDCPDRDLTKPTNRLNVAKDAMLRDFTDQNTNLDIEFKMEYDELEKEIDLMNKKVRDSIY